MSFASCHPIYGAMTPPRTLLVAILLLVPLFSAVAQGVPQLGEAPLQDVMDAMTTEEKAHLLVGMGFSMNIPGVPPMSPEDAKIPEKVPGAAGRTHAIVRLGIPSLTLSDGPAGVRIAPVRKDDSSRTYHATAFPVATLLASSWDTALARNVGAAFGREVREYGIDILLAPGLNLHRNPLGGRNFEYYSEDPLVTGRMAAAFVNGVESEGVGTSIKHFAANNQEFNRMKLNTIVSERVLRELYLKGFEIAIKEAQPWTVMSAYNLINGTHTSQSEDLLTTILRQEWGFEGFVMSDWFGGSDPVAQVVAGNDVLMPGNPGQTEALIAAVEDGTLSEETLNTSVERVLQVVLASPTFREVAYSDAPDLEAHAAMARQAATEGMVLLKNEAQALPLAASQTIALFGNASYDLVVGGTGSGDVNEAYSVSLDAGLTQAGYTINIALENAYTSYIDKAKANRPPPPMPFMLPPPIPEMPVDQARIQQAMQNADVAVITLGRNSGEFADRVVENDFDLADAEQALIREVSEAFHAAGKAVVVVMNVGGVIEVASWRDVPDAILLAWQPGQEGGLAIADVLSGQVNPSGKLASTFPIAYTDVPSAGNFPGKELPGDATPSIFGVPSEVVYDEGIYVGYRYYNTFDVEPAYPFGYGLSYTDFDYGEVTLSATELDEEISATITVTNTGEVAGRDVVQVYVGAPAGAMDKPESELRAFAKTDVLQPGASQTLTFRLTAADLPSYDSVRSAWVAAAGTYTVKIGASSRDIRQQATFALAEERLVETAHPVLVPAVPINERTAPGAHEE
jgi:beta-glucosidase